MLDIIFWYQSSQRIENNSLKKKWGLFCFGLAWLTPFREKLQLYQQKVSTRAFCQVSQRNAALGHSATPAVSQLCRPCQSKLMHRGDVLPSYLNFCEFRFMCHLIEFLFSWGSAHAALPADTPLGNISCVEIKEKAGNEGILKGNSPHFFPVSDYKTGQRWFQD